MVWAAKLIFYTNVRKERLEPPRRELIKPDSEEKLLIIDIFILTSASLTKSL